MDIWYLIECASALFFAFWVFASAWDIVERIYNRIRKRKKTGMLTLFMPFQYQGWKGYLAVACLLIGGYTTYKGTIGGDADIYSHWQKKDYVAYYDAYANMKYSDKSYQAVAEIKHDHGEYYIDRLYFDDGYIEQRNGDFFESSDLEENIEFNTSRNDIDLYIDIQGNTDERKIETLADHELSALEYINLLGLNLETWDTCLDNKIHFTDGCPYLTNEEYPYIGENCEVGYYDSNKTDKNDICDYCYKYLNEEYGPDVK